MIPAYLSKDLQLLLKSLLEKDPSKRLTSEQVKSHPWFKSIDWKKMFEKKEPAPFVPFTKDAGDTRNFDKVLFFEY